MLTQSLYMFPSLIPSTQQKEHKYLTNQIERIGVVMEPTNAAHEMVETNARATTDAQLYPPPEVLAVDENITANPSHDGRYIQYNIRDNIIELTAKYKPPVMPIGRGAYGFVW